MEGEGVRRGLFGVYGLAGVMCGSGNRWVVCTSLCPTIELVLGRLKSSSHSKLERKSVVCVKSPCV